MYEEELPIEKEIAVDLSIFQLESVFELKDKHLFRFINS